jgi:phage/plasmid-associated DNA primase
MEFQKIDDLEEKCPAADWYWFARDVTDKGAKVFEEIPKNEFHKYVELFESNRHSYEILPSNQPIHPYFDCEMEGVDDCLGKLQMFQEWLTSVFEEEFDVTPEYIVLDSCRGNKLSYHLVLCNCFVDSVQVLKPFILWLFSKLDKTDLQWEIGGEKRLIFDKVPYGNRQNVRMKNQSKKGKPYVLKSDASVMECMIRGDNGIYLNMEKYKPVEVTKPIKVQPIEVKREKDEVYSFVRSIIEEGLISHLSTNYDDWMRVGMTLKTIDAYHLFLLFSQTSKTYDEKGCREAWNGFKPSSLTIASLYYWAKQQDKMTYYALMERKMSMNNEYEMSLVANRIVDNVVRVDDDFYLYDSYWKKCTANDLRSSVMKELRCYVMSCLSSLSKKIDLENYDEIVTRLRTILNGQINKTTCQKNILDQYCINMPKTDVDMDTLRPYYFCFKNCAFDLRTNRKVETTRDDFITQNAGYDYEEPTKEQVDEVARLVESILPDPEKRRFYMSVLRTGMIGMAFENLIFATGEGGNGKGLLNDFFAEMMGRDYYYKGDKKTLTEPMKQGANPEVANIHKKRTVIFSEPEQGAKIQVGTMKELTGGGVLCARGLYQSSCVCKLTLTAVLEYNTKSKPTLNGDVDDAIQRRLKVCKFDQSFKLKPVEGEQQANLFYKTDEFKTGYRCALFKYLMRYDDIELFETEVIHKETMDYFFGSDEFLGWFDSHFELTDDETDFVSLKDMLDCYKGDMKGRGANAQLHEISFWRLLQAISSSRS